MGTSLESVNALRSRALEVALSTEDGNSLVTNGVKSSARLAFAACAPGQTPIDPQLTALLAPVPLNPGNSSSLKLLIFEAEALVCNEVKRKGKRRDDTSRTACAGPERDARV